MQNKIATIIIKSATLTQTQSQPTEMYQGNINYNYDANTPAPQQALQSQPIPQQQQPVRRPTATPQVAPQVAQSTDIGNPFKIDPNNPTHVKFLADIKNLRQSWEQRQAASDAMAQYYHPEGPFKGGYKLPQRRGTRVGYDNAYRVTYDPQEAQAKWDEYNKNRADWAQQDEDWMRKHQPDLVPTAAFNRGRELYSQYT